MADKSTSNRLAESRGPPSGVQATQDSLKEMALGLRALGP